jgi:hypothetical protein
MYPIFNKRRSVLYADRDSLGAAEQLLIFGMRMKGETCHYITHKSIKSTSNQIARLQISAAQALG